MATSPTSSANARYTALDGLRGLAALVVLVHHCLLVSPELVEATQFGGVRPFESWVWWITFTPLHLFWAGKEAVYVFFILSGFVLTIPFVGSGKPSWATYFWKRLLRIYPPVWASLLLALVAVWAVPRVTTPEFSSWTNLHYESPNVLHDALLLAGASSLNSPLWSLQWELIFSLLLPVYVLVVLRLRRRWLVSLVGLFLLIGGAETLYLTEIAYLLVFGVGALMATRRDVLETWAHSLGKSGWAVLLVISMFLLSSRWLFPQLAVPICLAAMGGALLIFIFVAWTPAVGIGDRPLMRWLGGRSFSLYLVHEPIVVSVAVALDSAAPGQVALLALPLSLLVTEVFFRLVERPSHQFSLFVGKKMDAHIRREGEALSMVRGAGGSVGAPPHLGGGRKRAF
jgi:peptidoglycan/LPS O-acetylase OafA/YrhL